MAMKKFTTFGGSEGSGVTVSVGGSGTKGQREGPQAPVPEVTKEEAGEVESEDPSASATQDLPPAVADIAKAANPTLSTPVPVASHADAGSLQSTSRPLPSLNPQKWSSRASEDVSDSIVQITSCSNHTTT